MNTNAVVEYKLQATMVVVMKIMTVMKMVMMKYPPHGSSLVRRP